jgi:hypothetical protein
MKKDFIVKRSITMVEGKPHVETYSEQELVRCKDCRKNMMCEITINKPKDWFCADGERR